MAVHDGRRSVGSPASVRDRDLGEEGLGGVDVGLSNALAKAGDLSDLLEEEHLSGLVAVNADARGIVAAVFLAGKPIAEDLTDRLPVL